MEQDTDQININFKAIWQVFKNEKWLILGINLLFVILGLIYGYRLKEEFISEGKILPEGQGKSGGVGQFAGLAALAGVDLGGTSGGADAVRPDLYPDVLKSTPYFLNLLQAKFKTRDNQEIDFKSFYKKSITDGKVTKEDLIPKYAQDDMYTVLDKFTENSIKNLKARIICTYDKKTGIISISVKMPDPVVAAGVARFSMNYLTDYIINYRTEKQKRDLDFLAQRLAAAKGKYYTNQTLKASYTDQMPLNALRLQTADLQRERIESEYKISSGFYNTLLQKYEEAKFKMLQETPIIKILEPPVVPNFKSEPKKSVILLLFFGLGILFSLIIIFLINQNYKLIFRSNV